MSQRQGNIDVDVVANDLNGTQRSWATYMAGMEMVVHVIQETISHLDICQELNLGYDLFDEIMKARDIQAENMAVAF